MDNNTKTDTPKSDRRKDKKKEKPKRKDSKRSLSPANLTSKSNEPKSTSSTSGQQWKIWIKYSDLDLIPLEVDPRITVHELKIRIQQCEDLGLSHIKPPRMKLFVAEGKTLLPKSTLNDQLQDGAEVEVQISGEQGDTSSLSSFSSSTDLNDDSSMLKVIQTLRKEIDELKKRQLNGNSPRNSISEGNLRPLGSGTTTPPYSDSELSAIKEKMQLKELEDFFKNSLNLITQRMNELETKIDYKNSNFDVAMKELRILTASLRGMGGMSPISPSLTDNPNAVPTLKCKGTLTGHQGPVWTLAHNGEGLLFSGSSDKTIQAWDLKEKEIKQKHIIQGHQSIVHAVICTDNRLISGSDDKTIKVWSQETWKCLHTIPVNKIACALTFYSGNLFAGCYRCIKVWDLENFELVKELEHNHWVRAVRIANGYLFSGGHNIIKMFDINSWKCLRTLQHSAGSVYSLIQSGHLLLSGTYENTINVWDLRTLDCVRALPGHTGAVYALAIVGNKLFSGSYDTTIRVWDLNTWQCTQRIVAHQNSVEAIATDGENIYSASTDSTIKYWRTA